MDHAASAEALQWEVTQPTATAKTWMMLARETMACSFASAAAHANAVNVVFERAVRAIPFSYKLWTSYIEFRRRRTRALATPNEWFASVRHAYERALEKLPTMPLLWCSFMEFVMESSPTPRVTMVRHLVGRSLAALPLTQHHLVWRLAKRWCRNSQVPTDTVCLLWQTYLISAPPSARKEFLALLFDRGECDLYVRELTRYVRGFGSGPLMADVLLWERLCGCLLAAGWQYTGDWEALAELVAAGEPYALSPPSLAVAFAAFAYGQGRAADGRLRFESMLESAADLREFETVYAAAATVEDQLVDAFVAHDLVTAAADGSGQRLVEAVFGSGGVLGPLKTLESRFALWQNQTALRCCPDNAYLWCKRIELVREGLYSGGRKEELFALCEQAISQCTQRIRRVDCAAAQLYETYAVLLLEDGRAAKAAQILEEGGWRVPFHSPHANALLIGLWAEVRLMACTAPADQEKLCADFMSKLTAAVADTQANKRTRGGLFARTAIVPGVQRCGAVWVFAHDVMRGVGASEAVRGQLLDHFFDRSQCYTAEAGAYTAFTSEEAGSGGGAALKELERASGLCKSDAGAFLFLASQYISLLLRQGIGTTVSLDRLREVCGTVMAHSSQWADEAPCALCDVLVAASAVECGYGLLTYAVDMMHKLARTLIARVDLRAHAALVGSVLERAIRLTEEHRGVAGVRELCGSLVRALPSPALVQRVAVHWASIERRAGNTAEAGLVFDACANTQAPDSVHGRVFWKCWQSLCADDEAKFVAVARRRKQVEALLPAKSVS